MEKTDFYGIIYCVVNKTNKKVYVGQTTKTLEKRKKQHERNSLNVGAKSSIFHKALNSYGLENFEWRVLSEAFSKDDLDEREKLYINILNSLFNEYGYNMTIGGTCCNRFLYLTPKEVGKRISAGLKRRTKEQILFSKNKMIETRNSWSEEQKEDYYKKWKKSNPENFFKDKTWKDTRDEFRVDKFKEKCSKRMMGCKNPQFGKNHSGSLNGNAKKYICIETDEIFNSKLDAIDFVKGNSSCFGKHLKAQTPYKGYTFKELEERYFKCLETGIIYCSMADILRKIGVSRLFVKRSIKEKRQIDGFTFIKTNEKPTESQENVDN